MDDLLDGLGVWDFRKATQRIYALADTAEVTEADLLTILDLVPSLPTQYPAAFVVEHGGTTITRYHSESLLWSLGETFRQLLKRRRPLRRSDRLWERVEAVCLESRYGRTPSPCPREYRSEALRSVPPRHRA